MSEQFGLLASCMQQHRIELENELDALLEQTWAGMFELAQSFRYVIDQERVATGQWRDLLVDTPYQLLDLALCLCFDLKLPRTEAQFALEQNLYRAAFFEYAAITLNELLQTAESHFAFEHTLLVTGLVSQSEWFLSANHVSANLLRPYSVKFWNQHSNALLTHRQLRTGRSTPYKTTDIKHLGARWSPLKMPLVVVALSAGQEQLLDDLLPLLDEAAALFQLGRELGDLNRDLSRGSCSYPIASLMTALGLEFGAEANANQILLAAVVTKTLPELAENSIQRCETLSTKLTALGLVNLQHYLQTLGRPFQTLLVAYQQALTNPQIPEKPQPAFVLSPCPQLEVVLRAAGGALCDEDRRGDAIPL